MKLLIGSLLALVVVVVAKKKINKRKMVEVEEIDTTGVDWKDVDVKKG